MGSHFVPVPILPHKVVMPGSKLEAKAMTWAIAVMMLVARLAQVGSALVSDEWHDRRKKRICPVTIATSTSRQRL